MLRLDNDAYGKKLAFQNNVPFVSCISKINNTLIDNTEDLDIVMPMYKLTEHSKNYRKTTGEPNSGAIGNMNYSVRDSKSFNYKTRITEKLEGNHVEKDDVEIVVPLKYLTNFWRTLDIPLINCEVSLTVIWSEN